MLRKKREREILHNYMEVLAHNYEKMEPNEMSSSICEIYDRLNRPIDRVIPWIVFFAFAYSFICIAIFVVKLFRSKT